MTRPRHRLDPGSNRAQSARVRGAAQKRGRLWPARYSRVPGLGHRRSRVAGNSASGAGRELGFFLKRLVVSGINLSEGGPLTVLRDFLRAACSLPVDWEIVAMVHDRKLFDLPRVRFMEFRDSKSSWFRRLYYEYWHFHTLSQGMGVDVWVSLHDMSPRVVAQRQVVYCHQGAPFYRMPLRAARHNPRFFLFTLLYRHLYRMNLHANDLIVVQQEWIRQEFRRMFGVCNIAVAHPIDEVPAHNPRTCPLGDRKVILYPALARTNKNFETLCRAAAKVEQRLGSSDFEVRLMISGEENSYSAGLRRQYGGIRSVKFLGWQPDQRMPQLYEEASAIVFPSVQETWGLPITEGKALGKVLMLADLPYAHEALGEYQRARFFDPLDADALADLIIRHMSGEEIGVPHAAQPVRAPFAPNWAALVQMVTGTSDE